MAQMPIYLDYNATTPVDPAVAEAMRPYLTGGFGNPSSSHPYGRQARQAVETARAQVASLLGCHPREVIFTSGGTESNNTVIFGAARAAQGRRHIITTAIEHPAVLAPCRVLAAEGFEVTVLPVDGAGRVSVADVAAALTADTALVSVMLANNEVGTIQPVAEIAALAREAGALVHTDAAQAVGKIPVNVAALGVDFLSVAGHKLYAPKGIGVLVVREGRTLPRFMHGAGHENGRRAGTENVLASVGLGQAAEVVRRDLEGHRTHMQALRDRLWSGLNEHVADVRRNGHPTEVLPNTLSVSFRGVEANTLLARISDRVAASAGAACHADQVTVSDVLAAMDVPLDYAMGTLRLSVGRMTTEEEIDEAVRVIVAAVGALRSAG